MAQTHEPDQEYKSIRYLKSCLPDNVTRTIHLDVRKNNEFVRGLGEQNPVTVSASNLRPGERYAPAMVIWNNSKENVNVTVGYCLDGKQGQWKEANIAPGSNLAFRISEQKINETYDRHEVVWFCNSIRVGAFTWMMIT